ADPKRLLGVEHAGGEEDVLRPRGADQAHQPLHRVEAVDDAEPRGGDAELRGVGREAEVARHRRGHRPAHAVAVDHRHGRLGARLDGVVRARGAGVVRLGARTVPPVLPELRDVGSGGERLLPRAAEDDRADLRVPPEVLDDRRQPRPHRQVEGVPDVRPVEDDRRDPAGALDQELVTHAVSPGGTAGRRGRPAVPVPRTGTGRRGRPAPEPRPAGLRRTSGTARSVLVLLVVLVLVEVVLVVEILVVVLVVLVVLELLLVILLELVVLEVPVALGLLLVELLLLVLVVFVVRVLFVVDPQVPVHTSSWWGALARWGVTLAIIADAPRAARGPPRGGATARADPSGPPRRGARCPAGRRETATAAAR